MASKSNEINNVIDIEKLLEHKNPELDIDLSDLNDSEDFSSKDPDILLGSDIPENDDNDTDFSRSRALVRKPNGDITVRAGKRHLDRMHENNLLDAHDYQEKKIVHPDMDKYEILNTFREVRTKVLQESKGKNMVLMVVSLQHGMGATFSAVNLAAAFSYEGEKTSLLIDCDQHKRKLEKFFNRDVNYGLTDYLEDNNIGTEKIIYQTGINRMRYIPVGKRRETVGEFFSSERMIDFITHVKKRYSDRFVILNAPPVEVTADAAILSEVSDFIIFILPYGKISNQRIQKAIKLLPKEKIIGFVINNKIKHV